jgi:hypothetical protein
MGFSKRAYRNYKKDRFVKYNKNYDPADYEVIGLFDAGFMFLGLSIGALSGFITSGGREMFFSGEWIDTLVSGIAGVIIGLGIGQISHAIIVLKKRR